MRLLYILNEHGEIEATDDTVGWAKWFDVSATQRRVASTKHEGVCVSTVFLGLDHNVPPDPLNPLLYETMVFGGQEDSTQVRRHTRAEALAAHLEICKLLGFPPPEPTVSRTITFDPEPPHEQT